MNERIYFYTEACTLDQFLAPLLAKGWRKVENAIGTLTLLKGKARIFHIAADAVSETVTHVTFAASSDVAVRAVLAEHLAHDNDTVRYDAISDAVTDFLLGEFSGDQDVSAPVAPVIIAVQPVDVDVSTSGRTPMTAEQVKTWYGAFHYYEDNSWLGDDGYEAFLELQDIGYIAYENDRPIVIAEAEPLIRRIATSVGIEIGSGRILDVEQGYLGGFDVIELLSFANPFTWTRDAEGLSSEIATEASCPHVGASAGAQWTGKLDSDVPF